MSTARHDTSRRPTSGRATQTGGRVRLQSEGDGRRNETTLEGLDRNLDELQDELRVVVTGVQVLFAFLLIVPFNSAFAHVGDFERATYFVTLLLAALAAACTIAPAAQHRILFRHDDKRHLVFASNRIVLAGLAFLALAMCGCILLVAAELFGVGAGLAAMAVGGLPFAVLWFAAPIRRRRSMRSEGRSPAGGRGGEVAAGRR
jgi:hypothetical protein